MDSTPPPAHGGRQGAAPRKPPAVHRAPNVTRSSVARMVRELAPCETCHKGLDRKVCDPGAGQSGVGWGGGLARGSEMG